MTLEITPDLVRRLKRLRLGGLLPTLPDRVAHARQAKLGHLEWLELLLQDEIDRRNSHGLALRLAAAGFDELVSFEQIVWDTPVSFDRPRVRELFGLHWLGQQENTGKKFTDEQEHWLEMIRDHIAANLSIEKDDFDYAPFAQEGGIGKVHQLFGEQLNKIIEELNGALAA